MAPNSPDAPPILIDSEPVGFMQKRVFGLPMPVVLIAGVLIAWLAYRHFKSTSVSGTSGTSSIPSAIDPNAIDPNTGLTFGAEEAAASGASMGGASANGTGAGGVGGSNPGDVISGGISPDELQTILAAALPPNNTNYYFPTPTSSQPGNGSGSTPPPVAPGSGTGGDHNTQTTPTGISGLPDIVSGQFADTGLGIVGLPATLTGTIAGQGASVGAALGGIPPSTRGGQVPVVSQPKEVAAGQKAVNEKVTVTPKGRAA